MCFPGPRGAGAAVRNCVRAEAQRTCARVEEKVGGIEEGGRGSVGGYNEYGQQEAVYRGWFLYRPTC